MAIDLHERDPEQLVCQVLELNELEQDIYFLLQDQEMTVKALVDKTNHSRSLVQRSLQDLLDKGLVYREGKVDKTVYYVYGSVPFSEVKDKVKEIINEWYKAINKVL